MDIANLLNVLRKGHGLEQLLLVEVINGVPDYSPMTIFFSSLPEPHLSQVRIFLSDPIIAP
jgi:hypothetical protein